jgi:hypothetical protein
VKTVQAIGTGFGVTLGIGAAIVLVLFGGAAIRNVSAQAPDVQTPGASASSASATPIPVAQGQTGAGIMAGWVRFDGNNLALCRVQALKDTSEATLAAAKEKMVGWTPLPPGSSCRSLGGQIRATCTGSEFQTSAFHYIGASAFGHIEGLRKECIEHGFVFKAEF